MSTQTATAFQLDYVKTIGSVTVQLGRGFVNPYDVVVSRDGRIFVLNRCDSARAQLVRVGIINWDEDYLGEFGKGYGPGDGQLMLPVAMALDSQERFHISDEHTHQVSIFDLSGEFVKKWGGPGTGDGQFNGPAGMAIDAGDHIYIADQHNHRIQKFTAEGEYVAQWGGAGSEPGQFNMPWGVTVDAQGDVYVADWRNDRIQKFDANGAFLASYGESGTSNGQFHRPSGVAVDPDGFMYISDWGNERLQVLSPEGDCVDNRRGQATLSRWAQEFFAVNPDERETRAQSNLFPDLPPHLSAPHHVSSQTEAYFWGPVSVRLDHEGRLFVVEANRHRIQVYQRTT